MVTDFERRLIQDKYYQERQAKYRVQNRKLDEETQRELAVERNAVYVKMATKHLEDFLDMKTKELKFYLRQRALSSTGTYSDLATRTL